MRDLTAAPEKAEGAPMIRPAGHRTRSTAALAEVLGSWTWGHTALGVAIIVLGPAGGLVFFPVPTALKHYETAVLFNVLMFGLPIVLAVRLADRAVDRGARAWATYGLAVLGVAVVGSWLGWWLGLSWWSGHPASHARNAWIAIAIATLYGLGVAAYVQWRGAQRAQVRLHRVQAERAHQLHQLQVQRLLALQARVDPQLLFDTLRGVLDRVPVDPRAADALLADLIALLRAMLPGPGPVPSSSVQREWELLRAHASVRGNPAPRLQAPPDAVRASVPPMLLLPLLRLLQETVGSARRCAVSARCDGPRLLLTLAADDDADPSGLSASPATIGDDALAPLRERLAGLFGADAALHLRHGPWPSMVLDLPYRDDDRADR
jgi:hypothetical protein